MKTFLALLLILAVCLGVMNACNSPLSVSSYFYDDAGQYTAGACTLEGDVHRIEIHWLKGSVNVEYYDEPFITLEESSSRLLKQDSMLHYRIADDTLYVQFARSGVHGINVFMEKTLTVYLPRDQHLDSFSIETVSAGVGLQELRANELDIETVSGRIDAEDLNFAREAEVDSVSGSIALSTSSSGELTVETTSGSIDVTADTLDSLELSTVSGNVTAAVNLLRQESNIETISGKIELYLPEDIAFTTQATTVSGQFCSDLLYTTTGNTYLCGHGSPALELKTTSGNIALLIS